jgi:poly-gamma-glutamate capsule biosynthesis protein CapA/YwtB (metallophosphatase superfamily)
MLLRDRWRRLGAGCLALTLVLGACTSSSPTPPTSSQAAPWSNAAEPTATATPLATPPPPVAFPLVVVTGYTNLKAAMTMDELRATRGLVAPCGIDRAVFEDFAARPACRRADRIVDFLRAHPDRLALLPPGLVEPATKVLPLDGSDPFGGPKARSRDYPLTGHAIGLPATWTAYHRSDVRTLISLGDSCPDRGPAYQAVTLGKGWSWVFGGGRARYLRVYPNPVPPGYVGNGYNIVDAVPDDDAGAVARLVRDADVTLDDFECPVVDSFTVHDGTVFSIDPAVLPHLRDDYGVDVVTLAANHLFDQGTSGFLETLAKFRQIGIPRAGAGVDLDDALQAAMVTRRGLRFAFVGFNQIVGSLPAGPGQPGVAWLTRQNVSAAVERARAAGDVVICVPQWWGGGDWTGVGFGAEYHATFRGDMRDWQAALFDAGCDEILGHGTHWSGPIDFTTDDGGDVHVTMVSHGNFLFGQDWSQQTQEGVIMELAFSGTRLVQARMHPYIMLLQAQTNLTGPETDGGYVLNRIFAASDVSY